MTYRPISKDTVLDFEEFKTDEEGLRAFIAHLEAITAPAHDASEHNFEDSPDKNGVCCVCGWVHPDVPALCCSASVRDHLLQLLQEAKAIRDGQTIPALEIEVIIIDLAPSPRRRGLFG